MSRSRSRSFSPTRRRRSRSRSHERRLSSRSRSPDGRRADRRRSRSPSTGDEEKQLRKLKKQLKKEKKRHKKNKHKKEEEVEVCAASDPVAAKEQEKIEAPANARSFFEQLQRREAAKQPVGTVHARAGPAPVSATTISTADKWECSKAGCGHKNNKHAPSCNKCGAMKRLTEWR